MQKVLATFYLNNDYYTQYQLIQDVKTGETFVLLFELMYNITSTFNVQEFEKDNNINLNDLLN